MFSWMKRAAFVAGCGLAAVALPSASAVAASCDPGKAGADMSYDEAQKVYECLAAKMHAGYVKGNKRWIPANIVKDYRGWTKASSKPANPGVHGERFLVTYVNAKGADEYMQFKEEGASLPAGSVLVKESFIVNGKGKASVGPLFIMQKAAAGKSPKTGDWYYMMVAPNGAPQGVNVFQACDTCHAGFEDQDRLGYPVEEVRASR